MLANHLHIIISTTGTEGINPFPTKNDFSNIVGKLKTAVYRIVGNALMHSARQSIWQTSFHDHIIRDEQDYRKISEYIQNNPARWEPDCFYSQ